MCCKFFSSCHSPVYSFSGILCSVFCETLQDIPTIVEHKCPVFCDYKTSPELLNTCAPSSVITRHPQNCWTQVLRLLWLQNIPRIVEHMCPVFCDYKTSPELLNTCAPSSVITRHPQNCWTHVPRLLWLQDIPRIVEHKCSVFYDYKTSPELLNTCAPSSVITRHPQNLLNTSAPSSITRHPQNCWTKCSVFYDYKTSPELLNTRAPSSVITRHPQNCWTHVPRLLWLQDIPTIVLRCWTHVLWESEARGSHFRYCCTLPVVKKEPSEDFVSVKLIFVYFLNGRMLRWPLEIDILWSYDQLVPKSHFQPCHLYFKTLCQH